MDYSTPHVEQVDSIWKTVIEHIIHLISDLKKCRILCQCLVVGPISRGPNDGKWPDRVNQ